MPHFCKPGLVFVGLVLAPVFAWADPPATLTQALVDAYYSNPTLQGQRAALRQADEQVPQALSGWRPTVILQANTGRITGSEKYYSSAYDPQTGKYVESTTKTPENGTQTQAQITLTQPIYTGGKVVAQTRQAKNAVYAARAQLISTEQTLFEKVVQAYADVATNQRVLKLEQTNQSVLEKQLQDTQTQFRLGEITMTSVAQAQASLAQAKAQVAAAQGNLQMARETFQQLVGSYPAPHLATPQPLVLPVKTLAQAGAMAISNNPDVIAAKFNDAAAKDAVDAAFAELMPNVSFQASGYTENNSSGQDNYTRGASFVGQLTVPLYQGGQYYADIRSARAKQQQQFADILSAQRQAYADATQAWAGLVSSRESILATNAQIKADAIALDGTEREELVGTRTTLDVLNAQEALLQAQVQQVQSISQLVTFSYKIAASVGLLNARDLALPVHIYNDQQYYNAVKYAGFGTGGGADEAAGIGPDGAMLDTSPVGSEAVPAIQGQTTR